MDERGAMARAIDLAWRGWGRVQPNPLVGAVVLQGGALVGEGWHEAFGTAHAEPIALAVAGERARGATLVVTLEPCAHQGKQPPCAPAVLAAGIRRVVSALADPNPAAAGGAEWLRAAGVAVEQGVMASEAAAQNAIFLHGIRDPSRPFVSLKLATSLDGRIADRDGRSRWISGAEARAYVQWLRAGYDGIGIGAGTAVADDPVLTVRGALQPTRPPLRVVFDRAARLGANSALVRSARDVPTLVVHGPVVERAVRERLAGAGVQLVEARTLDEALIALRARGAESLLVEGGGRLAGALLAADLVDRFHWVQSPLWLGERGVAAMAGVPSRALAAAPRWRVTDRRALGDDTLLVVDRERCSPAS